jgi:hypothetical protein
VWVGRVLIDDFVEVEEAGIGDAFFAEGLQAIAAVVGEEPGCAEGDGAWCCGDLARGVLFERFVEFGGRDEIGGERASSSNFEERMLALGSAERRGEVGTSSTEEGRCRHGVLSLWPLSGGHGKSVGRVVTMF